ncbi:MAG: c-type cytochrome, partial [Terriglobia bacterium]
RDGCYECHGRHAEGSTATGPRLSPLPVGFEAFASYVRHPMGNMPPYTNKVVSDVELADIFAFLRSLPAPPKVETIPLLKLK